jgi:L-iditol 2-dehydrogenase
VIALANSPVRLDMAARMGAHAGFLSSDEALQTKLDAVTDGLGVDLVILTANPWPAYRTALEAVRPGGRVSIVSLLGRGEGPLDFNPLSMDLFYNKDISLIAVSGAVGYGYPQRAGPLTTADRYAPDHVAAQMIGLMADGGLRPSTLITHRFHYSDMVQAYEMAFNREKSMLGVIFDWRDA